MRRREVLNSICGLAVAGVYATPSWGAEVGPSALERYRNLPLKPEYENFDKGWQERVELEFEMVNHPNRSELRKGLKDTDPYVRSISAKVLGFLADRESINLLAEMAAKDPIYHVRIRAIEALGFLKARQDVISAGKFDPDFGVKWTAKTVEGMVTDKVDHAAQARESFAQGIRRKDLASAVVGKKAPEFTAKRLDGRTFKLSEVRGKKPIAIYFAAFDG